MYVVAGRRVVVGCDRAVRSVNVCRPLSVRRLEISDVFMLYQNWEIDVTESDTLSWKLLQLLLFSIEDFRSVY